MRRKVPHSAISLGGSALFLLNRSEAKIGRPGDQLIPRHSLDRSPRRPNGLGSSDTRPLHTAYGREIHDVEPLTLSGRTPFNSYFRKVSSQH